MQYILIAIPLANELRPFLTGLVRVGLLLGTQTRFTGVSQ